MYHPSYYYNFKSIELDEKKRKFLFKFEVTSIGHGYLIIS